MTKFTDFEEWKAAGIAAGLIGPTQVQGKDMYVFGDFGITHGVWTGNHGVFYAEPVAPANDSLTNTPVNDPLPEVT
jgi:hypothetical protein